MGEDKDLAGIIANKLGAKLTLGEVKGYSNKKLDSHQNPSFLKSEIGLDEGLGKIIAQAIEYRVNEHQKFNWLWHSVLSFFREYGGPDKAAWATEATVLARKGLELGVVYCQH